MEIAVETWNLLWDYQIHIALLAVFLIWVIVRGSDLIRWAFRKLGLARGAKVPPARALELPAGPRDSPDAGNASDARNVSDTAEPYGHPSGGSHAAS
jgi:hypothetical protein